MKKFLIITAAVATLSFGAWAQTSADESAPAGWHTTSPTDGQYGAATTAARQTAAGMRVKKEAVVALIGTGIDVDNAAIKEIMWRNKREKADGRDNDRNGLVDDINGWNFLATPDGAPVERISRAGDREYVRLRDKYIGLFSNGGKFYRLTNGELTEVSTPENADEYYYFINEVLPESEMARLHRGIEISGVNRQYLRVFEREMRERYPDGELTTREFLTLPYDQTDTLRMTAFTMAAIAFDIAKTEDWRTVVDYMNGPLLERQQQELRRVQESTLVNDRLNIGDDPYDLQDRSYGSSSLMAENAGLGTMLAGVVGGRGERVTGVADAVRVMSLRIQADDMGEPYMKDMALAIRYAVDHGADVIQLGATNTFNPKPWHSWVDDALRYAESKGVLVVIPMMDISYDIDKVPFYPNKNSGGGLSNIITVAASDVNGNPMDGANFGRQGLDLFAPGVDISSSYTGNMVATASSSQLAASMVSGAVALIKSRFPQITAPQLRELLMETVTDRSNAEVEKSYMLFENGRADRTARDLFLFEDLSVAKGILNVQSALERASQLYR